MRPLIDGDVILYEVGFASETGWRGGDTPPFDYVAELLTNRIAYICREAGGDVPPTFFFTGKTNFRTQIAKLRKYKERDSNKPFHYKNIRAYIKHHYDWREQEGLEADDLMAIEQTRCNDEYFGNRTIICTRDKDCYAVEGLLYGWEIGKQPSRGPLLVTELGEIQLNAKRNKIVGSGGMFFYSQCLTGDTVDTIPGLLGCGPVKAFEALSNAKCLEDAYNIVLGMYCEKYGEQGFERLIEQGRLLHMTRIIEGSNILLWNPPNYEYEDWYDLDTREIKRVTRL